MQRRLERGRIDPVEDVALVHMLVLPHVNRDDRPVDLGRNRRDILLHIGIVGLDGLPAGQPQEQAHRRNQQRHRPHQDRSLARLLDRYLALLLRRFLHRLVGRDEALDLAHLVHAAPF